MKKIISLTLAVMMLFAFTAVAFADESTTTLTTTVPSSSYTLNIPTDQSIPYAQTSTDIGAVTVTNGTNFAYGKDLKVTLTYDGFKTNPETTTIPFTIIKAFTYNTSNLGKIETGKTGTEEVKSGESLIFKGKSNGTVNEICQVNSTPNYMTSSTAGNLHVEITNSGWGKGLQGDYTAKIKFSAEVVLADAE